MKGVSKKLLCRSPLFPGESLISLLTRLTVLNRYPPHMIGQLCRDRLKKKRDSARPSRSINYQILAELVDIEADELYGSSVHRFAATITPPDYDKQPILLPSGRRVPVAGEFILRENIRPDLDPLFCPLCLKESAYHRLCWMPIASAACLDHRCLLVHRCPQCQNKIAMQDILRIRCSACGFQLSDSPITSLDTDGFGMLSQYAIQSWLLGSPLPDQEEVFSTLPDKPRHVLYWVLVGLFRAIKRIENDWFLIHRPPNCTDSVFSLSLRRRYIQPLQSYIFFATAFKGLMEWPYSFLDFLNAYPLRDNGQLTGNVKWDLGLIHRHLEKTIWTHSEFNFVQDVYNQYLLDNRKSIGLGTIRERCIKNPGFKRLFNYNTQNQVAEKFHTTTDMVRRFVQTGFLITYEEAEGRKPPSFSRTSQPLVRSDCVKKICSDWSYGLCLPLQDVSQLLGTSDDIVLELIDSGLLVNNKGLRKFVSPTIGLYSINKFLTKLQENTVGTYPSWFSVRAIDLVVAAQKLSIYKINVASIIKMVFERELRGCWPKKEFSLDRLMIYHQDVETLMMGLNENRPMITQDQVAYMMRVCVWDVRTWVEEGLLEPVSRRDDVVYFDLEAVRLFRASQVS